MYISARISERRSEIPVLIALTPTYCLLITIILIWHITCLSVCGSNANTCTCSLIEWSFSTGDWCKCNGIQHTCTHCVCCCIRFIGTEATLDCFTHLCACVLPFRYTFFFLFFYCKDVSQLNLQTMKKNFFVVNFSKQTWSTILFHYSSLSGLHSVQNNYNINVGVIPSRFDRRHITHQSCLWLERYMYMQVWYSWSSSRQDD